jgi:hypothetical protein
MRLRLRLWKYEAVWHCLVSDGEWKEAFHPSRGVRLLINVQPGETASAKAQRTQRRFIIDAGERIEEVLKLEEVLMTRRVIKHYWRDAQKPSEIRRRIDRMFRCKQYRNTPIFIILLHTHERYLSVLGAGGLLGGANRNVADFAFKS